MDVGAPQMGLSGGGQANIRYGSTSNGVFASLGRAATSRLSTITDVSPTGLGGRSAMFRRAVHPGQVLAGELEELGISPTEFARAIGVPPNRVSQIIAGKRAVTGDTALRFGHWFGIEPEFWMNLQGAYHLKVAAETFGPAVAKLPTMVADIRRLGPCQNQLECER
jgi:addiction module HigA family antidote